MQVLQRPFWNGTPLELGDLFRLTKGPRKDAHAAIWSHQFGWEIRLMINGGLSESTVCRTEDQVLTTGEQWKARMAEKGWR